MTLKDIVPFRKYDPSKADNGHPFALLRKEMDSLFENFWRGFETEPIAGGRLGSFAPKVDIIEGEKALTVTAELPGMDEKDIDVSLTRDSLTIRGEKKEEKEEKTKDYYRMERSFGSFARTIPLPVEIDTEKVEAQFKKGILTVSLPKTEKALTETKKIEVKTG
jgi:HSP20 family protein